MKERGRAGETLVKREVREENAGKVCEKIGQFLRAEKDIKCVVH